MAVYTELRISFLEALAEVSIDWRHGGLVLAGEHGQVRFSVADSLLLNARSRPASS